MRTVGIIGAGSFGLFLAEKLSGHCTVKVYSHSDTVNQWQATLDEVAACDFVIPSIPLQAYETVLTSLKGKLGKDTVVVDICSVKEKPLRLLKQVLPGQPIVATHPLFGPESAAESLEGHVLVMCPDDSDPEAFKLVLDFVDTLGLTVKTMSGAEHDQEMAIVHGLTFFVVRALHESGIHEQALQTPSFQRLLDLADLDQYHSEELFQTMEAGNPYAKAVRQKFIEKVQEIDEQIK